MLRTNLSTRPFYNERAVRLIVGVVMLLTFALTVFNVAAILNLSGRNSQLAGSADAAEAKARELRNQAQSTRASLNRDEVDAVQGAAREANMLIDRRAFSWTDLFNRFEETLPPEVRIVAVQPQIDDQGRMLVAFTVISRSIENLDTFIDRLEDTGAFSGVISRQEIRLDDGTLRSTLQGYYAQPARPATTPAPAPPAVSPSPSSESNNGTTPRRPAETGEPR